MPPLENPASLETMSPRPPSSNTAAIAETRTIVVYAAPYAYARSGAPLFLEVQPSAPTTPQTNLHVRQTAASPPAPQRRRTVPPSPASGLVKSFKRGPGRPRKNSRGRNNQVTKRAHFNNSALSTPGSFAVNDARSEREATSATPSLSIPTISSTAAVRSPKLAPPALELVPSQVAEQDRTPHTPNSPAAADFERRPRMVWTSALHERFGAAVAHFGIDTVTPKQIMASMGVSGLTRENVASHLQKYRAQLRRERSHARMVATAAASVAVSAANSPLAQMQAIAYLPAYSPEVGPQSCVETPRVGYVPFAPQTNFVSQIAHAHQVPQTSQTEYVAPKEPVVRATQAVGTPQVIQDPNVAQAAAVGCAGPPRKRDRARILMPSQPAVLPPHSTTQRHRTKESLLPPIRLAPLWGGD